MMFIPRIKVRIKYLRSKSGRLESSYATDHSAGVDLRAAVEKPEVILPPGGRFAFPSGICIQIDSPGVAGFVFSRSGLGTREGLVVSQGVGVIDPDYRGEIVVSLLNTSKEEKTILQGQRIAQLVFMPIFQADFVPAKQLEDTKRGDGGFGHSGDI
ncbi:MAG: dUTP diphosphatase [Desulfonatronovibrionaceae bacterium]